MSFDTFLSNQKCEYDLSDATFIRSYLSNNFTNTSVQCGIGDMMLLRLINGKAYSPNINIKSILDYKPFPKSLKNIVFLIKFSLMLFDSINLFYSDTQNISSNININTLSAIKDYDLSPCFNLVPKYAFKYIVFHTKLRLSCNMIHIIQNYKTELKKFCMRFKSPYKIILLGERIIDPNIETQIHNITTIYDELLLLKENNDVIDMTQLYLSNVPDIDHFLNDMSIIRFAQVNIGVGIGGQYCTNLCISPKTIYCIPSNLMDFKVNKNDFTIYHDIEQFIKALEQL